MQNQHHQILTIAELLFLTFRAPNNQVISNAQQALLDKETNQNFTDILIAIIYNSSFQQSLRMAASTYLKTFADRIIKKNQFSRIVEFAKKLIQIFNLDIEIKYKKIIASTLKHLIIKEVTKQLRRYLTIRLKKQLQQTNMNVTNFNHIYFVLYGQFLLSFPIYDILTNDFIQSTFPLYINFTINHLSKIEWEFQQIKQLTKNIQDYVLIIIQQLQLLQEYFLLIKYYFKRDFKSCKEFYQTYTFNGIVEQLISRTLNLDPYKTQQSFNHNNLNCHQFQRIIHLNTDKISNHLNKIKRYALFVCESILRNKFKRIKIDSRSIQNTSSSTIKQRTQMVMEYQNHQQISNNINSPPIINFLLKNFARFLQSLRLLVSSTVYKYYHFYGMEAMKISAKILRLLILLIHIPDFQDSFRNFQSKIIYEIILPLFQLDPQQRKMFIQSPQMFFGGIDFIIDHNTVQTSSEANQESNEKSENETFQALVSQFLVEYTKYIHGVLPEIIIFIIESLSSINKKQHQHRQFSGTQKQILWFIFIVLMQNTKRRPDIYQLIHNFFLKEVIPLLVNKMEVQNTSIEEVSSNRCEQIQQINILNYFKIKSLERYIFYFKPTKNQSFIDNILKMSLQILNSQTPKSRKEQQIQQYQSKAQIKNVTIELLFTLILLENQHTKEKFVQIFNIFINQIKKNQIQNSKVLDIIYEIFKQDKSKFIFQKFLLLKSIKEIVHRIQKQILQQNDFVNRFQQIKDQNQKIKSVNSENNSTDSQITTIKISNKNLMVIYKCLHIFKIIASSIEVLDFINRIQNQISILNRYLLEINEFEDDFVQLNVIFIKSRKKVSQKQLSLFNSFYKIFNSNGRLHQYLFELFNLFVMYGSGILQKFHVNYLIDIACKSMFISQQQGDEEQEQCKGSLILQNILISFEGILDQQNQSQIGRNVISRLKNHIKYSFLKANLLNTLLLLLLKNKTMLESDMETLTNLILNNYHEFQDKYSVKIFTIYMGELLLKYKNLKSVCLINLCSNMLDKIGIVLIKYYNHNCHGVGYQKRLVEEGKQQYLTGYYKVLLKFDYPVKSLNQYVCIQNKIQQLKNSDLPFYNYCISRITQKGLDSLKEVVSIKIFETGPRLITKINRRNQIKNENKNINSIKIQ